MNYVLAKVKIKNEEGYRKLYKGEAIFEELIGLTGANEYTPSTILDEDEWFKLSAFSTQEYCLDFLCDEFNSTEYAEIDKARTDIIEYICSYQSGQYYFQRILKHSIFKQKRLTLGDNVNLDKGEKSIVINDYPDAMYDKKDDTLYFRKLQTIAPIFKGIDILYKEATKEETESFLQNDFIETIDGYGVDKIKTMNRKRIAMAMETLKNFNKKQRKEVLDYTHEYYPHLQYKGNTFSVGTEDDMKFLLWGIEQRYYTTPVTKEQRVANSVIPLAIQK